MNFYTTPNDTINTTASFGLDHPASVKKLLEAAEALDNAAAEVPGWDGVLDPKKVAGVVRAHAEHAVSTGQALTDAANQARGMIARAISEAVAENLEDYLQQADQRFNRAAKEYTEAAQVLPREFTAEDVTGWEPELFEAYTRARHANTTLEAARVWMLNLGKVIPTEAFPSTFSSEFLVLSPDDLDGYVSIQTAGTTHDNALQAINPVRLKAVKDGVALSLSLPSEVREAANRFEQQRQALTAQESQQLRARAVAY